MMPYDVEDPRTRRHRVVFVDDEPAVLEALRRSLKDEPYQVLTTQLPEVALEWVETGEVSLVVSDQRMPAMAGSDLLAEVGRRSPATGRMILTAYPGPTSEVPELWRKADGVIAKPWDVEELRREIRRVLLARDPAPGDPFADLGD